jgi:hypothetical protein
MPPVRQVGQVLNLQVHGRQVNLNLNLGFFLQEGMLPTPSHIPIHALVGAVVGAYLAEPISWLAQQ